MVLYSFELVHNVDWTLGQRFKNNPPPIRNRSNVGYLHKLHSVLICHQQQHQWIFVVRLMAILGRIFGDQTQHFKVVVAGMLQIWHNIATSAIHWCIFPHWMISSYGSSCSSPFSHSPLEGVRFSLIAFADLRIVVSWRLHSSVRLKIGSSGLPPLRSIHFGHLLTHTYDEELIELFALFSYLSHFFSRAHKHSNFRK